MSGNPKQKLKLLYIADFLKNNTDSQHPASTEEIMGYLKSRGVASERKSIYTDIEVLKEYGLDIVRMRSGTYRGYYVPGSRFEAGELLMLINALQASPIISRGKTAMLIKKLRDAFEEQQGRPSDNGADAGGLLSAQMGDRLSIAKSENEELYSTVECISRAIAEEKKISFIYKRRRLVGNLPVYDNGREFTLSPYAAIWSDDRFYLVGNIEKYDDLSHYRIDRMNRTRVLAEPARHFSEVSPYTTRFDTADYARGMFNMFSGGEEMNIKLSCKDRLLEAMIERFGLDTRYMQLPTGRFTLSTRTRVSDGFIYWLLSFGGDVLVEEPVELRERVKSKLGEMLGQYSETRRRTAVSADKDESI